MLTDRDTNPLCGARFIHSKAEAPPVVKGPVHRDDPCLERIDALLAPPEEAPVGELPQVPRVHVRQFVQVPLAHGDVVVDGPLQPPRPLTIPIVVDAVEDLLAAGVQGFRAWVETNRQGKCSCHRVRLPPPPTEGGGNSRLTSESSSSSAAGSGEAGIKDCASAT